MDANEVEELRRFVAGWCRAAVEKDMQAADAMRRPDYVATLPDGSLLSKQEELDLIAGTEFQLERCVPSDLRVERHGGTAIVHYQCTARGQSLGGAFDQIAPCILTLRKAGAEWQASAYEVSQPTRTIAPPAPNRSSLMHRLRRRLVPRPRHAAQTFQDLAYLPYRPGEDVLLPPRPQPEQHGELPVPPEHLWLGYNYPVHGERHLRAMLDICEAGGFVMEAGKRVLDFGCGAGRMIRHLAPYAAGDNIWGVDISAEHILWCKRHLSPPFHFATTTKVPHLPFDERSFDLIFCGSVFTHIDDMADAWLLELRRLLSPEGRLFVTIHDEHTMALLGGAYHVSPLAGLTRHKLFKQAEEGFSMLSIGRDDLSQVFYRRDEFLQMASSAFDIVSVTEEAYFYQTGILLRRR